jgi:hypothetical protein
MTTLTCCRAQNCECDVHCNAIVLVTDSICLANKYMPLIHVLVRSDLYARRGGLQLLRTSLLNLTRLTRSDINTRSFPSAVPSLLPKVILTTFQSTTTLHNNGFDNSLCCKEETRSMRRQWLLGYANHKNPKLVRTNSVTPTQQLANIAHRQPDM